MDLTSPFPFRHQRTIHMPKPLEISVSPIQEHSSPCDTNNNEIPSQSTPVPPSLRLDTSDYAMGNSQNENEPEQHSPDGNIQISTSYFRPRSPLPPTKLANIANALGVNTPMPAAYIRSPSPSAFRSPSRFLLHIVPPPFLPSDDDDDPTLSTPPDGINSISITSYRTQFRRGTLIPLYPTLRSQLGAIAREYSLPSTGGLVLYLSQTAPDGTNDGPRISDEVWKLLWYRALQAERQEQLGVATTSRAPSSLALRSTSSPGNLTPSSSSPFQFDREFSSSLSSLSTTPTPTPVHAVHAVHAANAPDIPSDTDTSTSTATSNTSNPSPSTATTTTGFTSLDNESTHTRTHPDLLAIASDLTPNPFLPILAKVEFDIDLRKAKWYDGWLKARKERAKWKANAANANTNTNANFTLNLNTNAKRDANSNSNANANANASNNGRIVPLPLELPNLAKSRSRLDSLTSTSDEDREKEKVHDAAMKEIGYALLNDGDNDGDGHQNRSFANGVERTAIEDENNTNASNANADDDDDDDGNDGTREVDTTVRIRTPLLEGKGAGGAGSSGLSGHRDADPLADIFGTDADTWAALKHELPSTRRKKAQDSALVIDDAGADHDQDINPLDAIDDEADVLRLWNDHQKPTLRGAIGSNVGGIAPLVPRRPAPPPLKIASQGSSSNVVAGTSGPRSAHPVMQRSFSEASIIDGDGVYEKRVKHHTGIVLGDGSGLGFGTGLHAGKIVEEPTEEEGDRSSQVIMKQKLDILEKQLAQLTPRKLNTSSPPLPPLPSIGFSPAEKLFGTPSSSSRREKEGSASVSPSPSPSASPRKRLSVHKRGRSSMSSTSSSSRPYMEHQSHQQNATHALHISKGSKGPITPPPITSSKSTTERTPPQLTLRPASGATNSIASTNSRGSSSGSGFNFDRMSDGNGVMNGNDEGQELIVVPPTRGSSTRNPAAHSNINPPDSPPLLPLSPDPFGKRDVSFGDGSHISEPESYLPLPPLSPPILTSTESQNTNNALQSQSLAMAPELSTNEKQSSRFSADSEQSIEAASSSSNGSLKQKRPRSNSIMSVRGLRALWRKSSAATTAATPAGTTGSVPKPGLGSTLPSSSGGGRGLPPPLPVMPPLPLSPPNHAPGPVDIGLPTPPSSTFTSSSTSVSGSAEPNPVSLQHSRQESLASVKSLPRPPLVPLPSSSSTSSQSQQPQLRPRRPSASPIPRPESGSDPFQFDSVLYKSPSTPSLLNGINSVNATSPVLSNHKPNMSIVSSKGILKNWTGGPPNTPEAELRKARMHQQQNALGPRRPSESRPESTASVASDRSVSDSRRSVPSPPPSPPKPRRSTSQSRLLQLQLEGPTATANPRASLNGTSGAMMMTSHSLPTSSLLASGSTSRFAEFPSVSVSASQSHSTLSSGFSDESFEIIPSRRLTPSASYSGDIL